MARVLRRCPKCSRKITNKIECKNCGLIFDRYFKAEAEKRAVEKGRAEKKAKTQRLINSAISLVIIALLGGAAFYYYSMKTPVAQQQANTTQETGDQQVSISTQADSGTKDSPLIARAKQATVAISSPWGNGTGFFVGRDLLVTNRHLVEKKKDGLSEAQTAFENYRDRVSEENEKLETLKQQFTEMEDGDTKDELAAIIEDGDLQLEKALAEQQRLEDKVRQIEERLADNKILVVLADGQKKEIRSTTLSENFDLALLTIVGTNISGIELPDSTPPLQEGAEVFMLGPNNVSVPTTFTGYHRGDSPQEFFILTDKPFNPSNSGSPLIDAAGYVRGINTLSDLQPEGSGLAIPIETVMVEFNL